MEKEKEKEKDKGETFEVIPLPTTAFKSILSSSIQHLNH